MRLINYIFRQPPVRIIAIGFLVTILLGSVLLMMPFSLRSDAPAITYIDSLYMSTSAVCVTGLVVVDIGSTFTPIGQLIVALLIQIGGLGVTTIGAGVMLAVGRKINLKGMNVIKEASNLDSGGGLKKFVRDIFVYTLVIELVGAVLSFFVFIQDLPFWTAVGVSLFHTVAAFNNAGMDILGGMMRLDGQAMNSFENLIPYQSNLLLNLTTSGLIILGGIGFLVMREVLQKKWHWRRYSMHTKVVLTMSAVLLALGTLLIKLSENVSWLGAFFFSVSTRTAGFVTYSLDSFSNAGLLLICILMFIGASPGSTGGGIKTTTLFTLLLGIKSSATNKAESAFKYAMPKDAFRKAAVICILALSIILCGTYLVSMFDPEIDIIDVLVEVVSAFATVGLSTGITPTLSLGSKIVSIIIMYIGRLGPLTIASLWYFSRGERFSYAEGNITIG